MMTAKGLAKLCEEMGELQQIIGKKLAYFDTDKRPDGKSISARMEEEMGDVLAAIDFVSIKFNLNREAIEKRKLHKLCTYQEWDKLP